MPYDQNYYLDHQTRIQDRQRDYYRFMPPEMKQAYLEVNRQRNKDWYRKKHPNAKPYKEDKLQQKPKGYKEPVAIPVKSIPVKSPYIVRNEINLIYLRWD